MKIKKFNQLFEAFNDSHFPISDDDIEDICLEMIDIGYELYIEKKYINLGRKDRSITKEPLTNNASPIYEIDLYKKDEDEESKPTEYWSGGLYFQESNLITMFDSIVNRFKKMFTNSKVLWHIRSGEFRIRIILEQVETKTGFDAYDFSERVNDWTESFQRPLDCTENFGNSSSKTIEFRRYYSDEEFAELLKQNKLDNKSDFDIVLRSFDKNFGKEASREGKNTPVKWSYSFEELEKFDYQPPKKGVFSKKPEKIHFTLYALEIKYEVVEN